MLKRIVVGILAMLLLAMAGTACHTVRGAGEDVQSVGETISGNTPP